MAKFDLNDSSVVVIVGSGAGGGTLGNELAQKGVKVVILEAGPRIENQDFVNDEWESFSQLAWTDARTTSGSWRVAKDFSGLPAWIVKAVGGSTTHWAGASLRFDEHEFKVKSTYGNIPGANLLDWPVTLAEMEPWYAKAENKMGVTRTNGIPGLPGNNNFRVMEAGAKKLGYKTVHTGNMAINSQPRDGRGACQQIGFCFQGCKSGAKWSTLYTEIPKGEATGNLEVRPASMAVKIEHDAAGKVTGVVYADESGAMQRQKARIVAVAGNSIESPRLLLNSASTMFPDGLGNSSGQVGRNYMRHMTGSVYAVFEKSVHMYRGTTMAGIIRDEAANNPKRGFVGGYEMETLSLGLPFMAAFLNPGAWGRPFTAALDGYPRMAGMWLVGEDMAQETNRITLDPVVKDKFGQPVASVHFDDHPNDLAMRAHAYKQGAAVYDAVGATVSYPTPPYPSTHNLGTNRMSEKPRGWCGQQVRAKPRRQEPVRLRRQPVHQRRSLQSDADHRLAGDPAGGLHCGCDAEEGNLIQSRSSSWRKPGPIAPGRSSAKACCSGLIPPIADGFRGMGPGLRQDDIRAIPLHRGWAQPSS
ncbi:choline dehydrogenase-like flavoprotein [Bradyrhizobium sp. GM7.3]